ncbi:neuropeptide CCHamide-1 receptor [Leptinotarsa decemlineata]|uniref:neuropeptide CCHamide-1 receptor n=1 Tax=Leptinotarsa decemlineata TaxID=7539 RepID=UPI003D308176
MSSSSTTSIQEYVQNTTIINDSFQMLNESVMPYEDRPETYIIPVLFFVIFVIGVMGNGTLVFIFLRHKIMRSVPNIYIFSLALADLLVLLTSVPFTSIVYTMESWPWGGLICKISETAKDISTGVSVFTLTALSADRFFAIADPLKKFHTGGGSKRAKRITIFVASFIWLSSIICAFPAAVGSHIKYIPSEEREVFHICYPFPDSWFDYDYPKMVIMAKFLILYVAPLIVIGVFYISMAVSLMRSTKNIPGEMKELHRQIKARKKVAITVLVFVVVFSVCLAPCHAFLLFFYFHPDAQDLFNDFWHALRIIGFCLLYINSCANPVALYFLSGAFRKYFNRYLLCIKLKQPRFRSYRTRQTTSISLLSTKTNQSINYGKGKTTTPTSKSPPVDIQEVVTLVGDGGNKESYKD